MCLLLWLLMKMEQPVASGTKEMTALFIVFYVHKNWVFGLK